MRLTPVVPPTPEFEARLFEAAEDLLARRREQLDFARTRNRHLRDRSLRTALAPLDAAAGIARRFALRPAWQAAAVAVVVASILLLQSLSPRYADFRRTGREAPEFPKFNDVPARYEAQRLAEEQAYEKEVENAHQQTSGGE